jgi:hypothetical protein
MDFFCNNLKENKKTLLLSFGIAVHDQWRFINGRRSSPSRNSSSSIATATATATATAAFEQ